LSDTVTSAISKNSDFVGCPRPLNNSDRLVAVNLHDVADIFAKARRDIDDMRDYFSSATPGREISDIPSVSQSLLSKAQDAAGYGHGKSAAANRMDHIRGSHVRRNECRKSTLIETLQIRFEEKTKLRERRHFRKILPALDEGDPAAVDRLSAVADGRIIGNGPPLLVAGF
jgi:hypothetical protein